MLSKPGPLQIQAFLLLLGSGLPPPEPLLLPKHSVFLVRLLTLLQRQVTETATQGFGAEQACRELTLVLQLQMKPTETEKWVH